MWLVRCDWHPQIGRLNKIQVPEAVTKLYHIMGQWVVVFVARVFLDFLTMVYQAAFSETVRFYFVLVDLHLLHPSH